MAAVREDRGENNFMTDVSTHQGVARWVQNRSPFGLFTTDSRLVVTEWNRWLEYHSGQTRQEVIGNSLLDLYPDLVTRQMDRYFDEALEGRQIVLSQALHGYLLPIKRVGKQNSYTIIPQSSIISPRILDGRISGVIGYLEDVSKRIKREKELIDRVTERRQAEAVLKDREQELRRKTKRLEEVNTALNVLLKKRERDKFIIEEKVLFNVKELIEPLIKNLKNSGLDESQTGYVDTLGTFLADIVSPFSQTLHTRFLGLTLSEIRVANLIKEGRTTKEIAGLLNSTPRAIAFHRQNIRKKLGLSDRKTNLGSHLLSLLE